MSGIRVISNNPEFKGLVEMKTEIPFSGDLKLQLIKPMWKTDGGFPLVVFIQGSSWTKPNQFWEVPQLSTLAKHGYVIASVTHRSAFEAPAPAFLTDVKTAIRFLRAHAAEYSINPDRVAVWGTSSGGNTALMVGLTGDDPQFETEEYADQSSKVQAVVDCFGPTDLVKMAEVQYKDVPLTTDTGVLVALGGCLDQMNRVSRTTLCEMIRPRLALVSPINYVKPCLNLPPFLMLHGDSDPIVLYEDTEEMYGQMQKAGYDVSLVRVTNAEHEGTFWSETTHQIILEFLQEKL